MKNKNNGFVIVDFAAYNYHEMKLSYSPALSFNFFFFLGVC